MLRRAIFSVCAAARPALKLASFNTTPSISLLPAKNYHHSGFLLPTTSCGGGNQLFLNSTTIIQASAAINSRTVTKFSMQSGKRKSVRTVLKRFYRLHWGGWIRTIAGRHRKMYRKSASRRLRAKQHVFCNATQSTLLDKMVTSYWRKPKYYVEDPYEPYHTREEFPTTYKKPRPYFPTE